MTLDGRYRSSTQRCVFATGEVFSVVEIGHFGFGDPETCLVFNICHICLWGQGSNKRRNKKKSFQGFSCRSMVSSTFATETNHLHGLELSINHYWLGWIWNVQSVEAKTEQNTSKYYLPGAKEVWIKSDDLGHWCVPPWVIFHRHRLWWRCNL